MRRRIFIFLNKMKYLETLACFFQRNQCFVMNLLQKMTIKNSLKSENNTKNESFFFQKRKKMFEIQKNLELRLISFVPDSPFG